ncbi:hypothetical protein X801_04815, partial [Opisthorchis viverrini]
MDAMLSWPPATVAHPHHTQAHTHVTQTTVYFYDANMTGQSADVYIHLQDASVCPGSGKYAKINSSKRAPTVVFGKQGSRASTRYTDGKLVEEEPGHWKVAASNLLFYYDCERAERPSGVAFLESSYCEPIVNLRSSRDERLGGQQGVSCASGVQLFPHQCLKFNKEVIGCQTTRFRQQETII